MVSPTGHRACAFVITRSWSTKKPDAMLFAQRSATVEDMDRWARSRVEKCSVVRLAAAGAAVLVAAAVAVPPLTSPARGAVGRSAHRPATASAATIAAPIRAFFAHAETPDPFD